MFLPTESKSNLPKGSLLNKVADFLANLLMRYYNLEMTTIFMATRLFGKPRLKRITIVMDKKTEAKLREIQGNLIANEGKNFSFSKTVNTILLAGISQMPKISSYEWSQIRSFIDKKEYEYEPLREEDYMENYSTSRL